MIRKTFILSFFALLFFGCGNSQTKIKYEKDSVKLKQDFLPGVAGSPVPETSPSLKEKVMGIWTDGSDVNATMEITPDSVFYPDRAATYKYLLSGDTIRIFYQEYTYKAIVSFKKDTMMMDSREDESGKFWKFKD